MKRSSNILHVAVTVAVVLALAQPLSGQRTTGQIVGTVYDTTGAVVPGVDVTGLNVNTGRQYSAVSGDAGNYLLDPLPVGRYTVTAELGGFKKAEVTNITLLVDQSARIDFHLETGEIAEQVTVEASSALLDTTTSDVGRVVENKTIVELPMNRREFMQLAYLEPGVVPAPPGNFNERIQGEFTAVSGMGQRLEYQTVSLNGVNNSGTHLQWLAARPSVDAIQEFKIQNSNYSAEVASKGSLVINLVIKSGTNSFHGSLFEFLRNDAFDARNFFDITGDTPPYKQNQFGGTFGGPIVPDKTFFFGAYEGRRITIGRTRVHFVPNDEQRQGIFDPDRFGIIYDPLTFDAGTRTRQPFPDNRIPQNRIHPTSAKIMDYIFPPNNPADPKRNLVTNPVERNDMDQINTRFDHHFGNSDSLFFSWNWSDRFRPVPTGIGEVGGQKFTQTSQHYTLSHTHIISPVTLNEFRFGVMRFLHREEGNSVGTLFESDLFGIPETETRSDRSAFPGVSVSGYGVSAVTENRHVRNWETDFQLYDAMTFRQGDHSFRLGVDFQRLFDYVLFCRCTGTYSFNGRYVAASEGAAFGDAWSQFLLGYPNLIRRDSVFNTGYAYGNQLGLFIQDDWRVTPKLTLNLGLRYDTYLDLQEKGDEVSTFDPASGEVVFAENSPLLFRNPATGEERPFEPKFPFRRISNRRLYEEDFVNFAPRMGFAYQLTGRTVMKGAYGIFNTLKNMRQFIQAHLTAPYWFRFQQILDPLVVTHSWADGFTGAPISSSTTLWKTAPLTGLTQPYNQQWNFGFQHIISDDILLDLAYVGNAGRELDQRTVENVPPPGPGSIQARRPAPLVGAVNAWLGGAFSDYHSFQTKLTKRFTDSASWNLSYTWSKAIDTNSTDVVYGGDSSGTDNPFDPWGSQKGLAGHDIPHRLVFNWIWQLPSPEHGTLRHVFGNWETTGIWSVQSGYPFTPSTSRRTNNGTGGRPDRTCDGELSNPSIDRWFDTSCFVTPEIYTYGNSGRTILRGDGWWNFDLGLFRNIPLQALGDGGAFQVRLEAFNLFNHPNFGLPVRNVRSGARGTVSSASEARQLQFGFRLVF